MDLFAPEYYKKFKCIADKCKHSCCIGWEIDVDGDTMEKYRSLKDGYGKKIIESVDEEGTPHFRLCAGDRCPHLDESGLCNIIKELGEGYLCHICREHPRFYNDTPYGKEVGVGMSCEEASRLILSSDSYRNIEKIGETDGDAGEFFFDPTLERERVYLVLSDRSIPYAERLSRIADAYGISLSVISNDTVEELEYLDERHKDLFLNFFPDFNTLEVLEKHLERALAYFVYRHCASAWDEDEFRSALGFALFCERLVASVAPFCESVFEAARIVSEEIEYSEDNTEAIKSIFD